MNYHEFFFKNDSMKQENEQIQKTSLDEEIKKEIEDIQDLKEEVDEMNIETQPKNELSSEIIDLQQELKESRDKLIYAFAEMENIRNRTKQDIEKAHKYALEKFVNELIPIIENLERSIENITIDETKHPVFSGVQLTLQMFIKAIEKFGVKQIDPLHEPFDPKFHEAISTQENSEVEPNTILTVLQKGYFLYDRLVRPALVIVSK